jgi:hypothetical protein
MAEVRSGSFSTEPVRFTCHLTSALPEEQGDAVAAQQRNDATGHLAKQDARWDQASANR